MNGAGNGNKYSFLFLVKMWHVLDKTSSFLIVQHGTKLNKGDSIKYGWDMRFSKEGSSSCDVFFYFSVFLLRRFHLQMLSSCAWWNSFSRGNNRDFVLFSLCNNSNNHKHYFLVLFFIIFYIFLAFYILFIFWKHTQLIEILVLLFIIF